LAFTSNLELELDDGEHQSTWVAVFAAIFPGPTQSNQLINCIPCHCASAATAAAERDPPLIDTACIEHFIDAFKWKELAVQRQRAMVEAMQ